MPGESKTLAVEAGLKDLGGDVPLVVVDGWNVTTASKTFAENGGAAIATNANAYVKRASAR